MPATPPPQRGWWTCSPSTAASTSCGPGRMPATPPPQRGRAEAGDAWAANRLATVLVEQGQVEDAVVILRPRADAGQAPAAAQLARLLAERGAVDELRARAESGDPWATVLLVEMLTER